MLQIFCPQCAASNPVGEEKCDNCGTVLRPRRSPEQGIQRIYCPQCGGTMFKDEISCPACGTANILLVKPRKEQQTIPFERSLADPQPAGFSQPDKPYSDYWEKGMTARNKASLYAILSIFVFPIVFGPLAIFHANQAALYGTPIRWAKVVGWIMLILALIAFTFLGLALGSTDC